jgi:predicted ArsR family transcriptional regulator
MSSERHSPTTWRFLTNHTQVLLCIARTPDVRLRDVAEQVEITERAAQRILADLVEAGFIDRERHGRRNHYRINPDVHMRHPAQEGVEVGILLELLTAAQPSTRASRLREEAAERTRRAEERGRIANEQAQQAHAERGDAAEIGARADQLDPDR